jgi:hypothetical protein
LLSWDVCSALALSADGATLAVSAQGGSVEDVFVFHYSNSQWNEVQVGTASHDSRTKSSAFSLVQLAHADAVPQVLPRPVEPGDFGFSMAFSSDAVYLAVSETPLDNIRVSCMLVNLL